MLRELRKRHIKKVKILDEILGGSYCSKFYIENHFMEMKLFKYLFLLRKNGANLNKFFDSDIKVLNRKENNKKEAPL